MALSVPEKKIIIIVSDLLSLGGCVLVAFAIASHMTAFSNIDVQSQLLSSASFGFLLLLVAYLNDCLDITSLRSTWRYLRRWWAACGVAGVIYLLAFFINGRQPAIIGSTGWELPRVVSAGTLLMAFFVVPIIRLSVESWLGLRHQQKNCIIVGAGKSARQFIETTSQVPSEWKICSIVDDNSEKLGLQISGCKVEARCDVLPVLVQKYEAQEIVLAISREMNPSTINALMICFEQGVDIIPVLMAAERAMGRIPLQHLGERWLPSTFWAVNPMPFFYDFFKRATDIIASLVGLAVALPIMAVAALATKLSSKGPIFYRQTRTGLHGNSFTIMKIRTMVNEAERDGAQWAETQDNRITTVGRFLRRTRIDEIPQLWNVLRGDMSLVGPRPERPEFMEKLEREIPFYRARLALRPGITGWAQIKHRYVNSVDDTKTKLEYDLYYIKNRSLLLDIIILGKTIKTVVMFKGT